MAPKHDAPAASRSDGAAAIGGSSNVSLDAGGGFVGRERELAELLAGLEDACASRGRLFLLLGEPGIGKTRTADELALSARRRGALVLVGRCYEGEGAPPYWPWVQVLRAYARATEPASLRASMGAGAADIAPVFDELAHAVPELSPPDAADAEARFRLFDGVTGFLKNAARGQPLVVILDDLHCADDASLLLLQFLARELGDAALLIIGAYRDVGGGRRRRLLDAIAELVREPAGRVLTLQGLGEGDVARFMTGAGGAPEAALVAAVHRRTAGNPFFVGQLLPLLAAAPGAALAPDAPAIPSGVHEVVSARLGRLSPRCRRLLEIVAVAGRELDSKVITSVAAADAAAGESPEALLDSLDEALQERLIGEVPGTGGTLAFCHALIRDALYAGLSVSRRVTLHRLVGEALERLSPAPHQRQLAELAHHFAQAASGGGDADKAAAYCRRAAAYARATLAYEEAARHYELALRVLSARGADARQECELLLGLGEAHRQASRGRAAREAYGRAVERARALGEPELLARAALGFAGVVIGVEVDPAVVAVLEEALATSLPPTGGVRATLLARLALELYFSPDAARRARVSAAAIETARASGDPRALAHALEARHIAMWGAIGPAERLALADETIRLAARVNSAELLMRAYSLRVGDLLELGRIEDVDTTIAGHARLAGELRQPSHRWGAEMFAAMRALIDGRFAEAEQRAAAALALGQSVQRETATNFYAAQMFVLRREQGRLGELEGALRALAHAHPTVPAWRCALASLHAEAGRRAEARRELDAVAMATDELRDLPRDNSWLTAVTLLAEGCAFAGDRARAATLYELILPHADLVAVAGVASACSGAVARLLGLLAATLQRWDDATGHFEHALSVNRRLGGRPFVARTQMEFAAMLVAASEAQALPAAAALARAPALLEEALATACALGMAALEARSRALLAHLGGNPPAPAESAAPPAPETVDDPSDPAARNLFRDDGGYWTLEFEGRICRLKDAKGLRYLALLVHAPRRPFHVLELLGDSGRRQGDAAAIRACRERLQSACEERDEAETGNDAGRAACARAEIERLTVELTDLLGLSAVTQDMDRDRELMRLRVTKAIKAAARRISAEHPALGHHLQTSIRTGAFCSYSPDPTKPIHWK